MLNGYDVAAQDAARKALFILVDGVPADVIENTDTPYLDEISVAGGYTRSYVGGERGGPSETPTISAPSYQSLITGTWANKHNVYNNNAISPDYAYWDIFRIAKSHDPSLKTALFSSWTENRTRLIGDGLEAAGGKKLNYYFDGFEQDTERFPHDPENEYIRKIDDFVSAEASRFISKNGPDLSWVYLWHTDEIGHRHGDGPRQIESVQQMDARIGKIWGAVKKRQAQHGEDWLIVVTTDHGRDAKTGMHHGGQSERERTIWIATNSNRLNSRFGNMPPIVDILPSIATHLGLEMPMVIQSQLDGQSFID